MEYVNNQDDVKNQEIVANGNDKEQSSAPQKTGMLMPTLRRDSGGGLSYFGQDFSFYFQPSRDLIWIRYGSNCITIEHPSTICGVQYDPDGGVLYEIDRKNARKEDGFSFKVPESAANQIAAFFVEYVASQEIEESNAQRTVNIDGKKVVDTKFDRKRLLFVAHKESEKKPSNSAQSENKSGAKAKEEASSGSENSSSESASAATTKGGRFALFYLAAGASAAIFVSGLLVFFLKTGSGVDAGSSSALREGVSNVQVMPSPSSNRVVPDAPSNVGDKGGSVGSSPNAEEWNPRK